MKKLNYLFITLFLSLAFISCEKDDDGIEMLPDTTDTVEAKIAGRWKLIDLETKNGKTLISFEGQKITTLFTQKGRDFDYITNFTTNPNKASIEKGSYTIETVTTVEGISSTQSLRIDTSDFPVEFLTSEWEIIDGGKFRGVGVNGNISTAKILELTDTIFKYSIDLSEVETVVSLDGLALDNVSISGESIITLQKL